MAFNKADNSMESSKKAEDDSKPAVQPKEQKASKGDLSELLEEVEEMYKTFLVSPEVVSKDSESKKTQPWRPRRVDLEKRKGNPGSSESGEGSPWPPQAQIPNFTKSPNFQPEWQGTDNLRNCMRKILHNPMYKTGDPLSPEDDMKVRGVLEYHPKAEEKTGPGIDYIKIDQVFDKGTRCFWVVRVDGTTIDFSYHKCLKAKVARESPELLEHYSSRYMDYSTLDLGQARRRVERAE